MRWLMMGYAEDDERVSAVEAAGLTVDTAGDADAEAWRTAARTAYDGIWVRWQDADHSVRPLVQYRAQRPTTRIVVEIPEDLTPPNPELAAWVQLGVYDVVVPDAEVGAVLRHPATIADALRWTGFQGSTAGEDGPGAGSGRPTTTVVEVERRVPLTNRPVLVVVVGTVPGAGTTTLTAGVARYLSQWGATALVEAAPLPEPLYGPTPLQTLVGAAQEEDQATEWQGITVFPERRNHAVDIAGVVWSRRFAYVVVDAGVPVIPLKDVREAWQAADRLIAVLPPVRTRLTGAWPWSALTASPDAPPHERPGPDAFAIIGGASDIAHAAVWPAPVVALPADLTAEAAAGPLAELLETVLPDTPPPLRRRRIVQRAKQALKPTALALGIFIGGVVAWHWLGALLLSGPIHRLVQHVMTKGG
ncbi:hypothetical protein [Sulfobacillus harzensis]|uniref:CobQ/CobB/MinD/ParA nucleotide binding domain-containing protein n=1 Tax=Sulfobacillus harzensis TaxID=2729629 RepID=A0A7Y0L631_9FIRM|nr:hypothetical protein [Sulfobacillus harzensis]NMP23728.1 hypothetical protein [Sulfobacillus harzensis]